MHRMSEGLGEDVIKMAPDCTRCPVCKSFLEGGETLHDHLNSHPKELVIQALIQLKDVCKDHDLPSSEQPQINVSSGPDTSRSSLAALQGVETDECNIEPEDKNAVEPIHEAHATSDAHFALSSASTSTSNQVVSYPQFLTGPAPVTQLIHLPVVAGSVPNAVAPRPVQTPVLLYGPFVCSPGSSAPPATSSSDNYNPARQVQLLTNNNVVRSLYSIIQPRPSSTLPQVPVSMQPTVSDVKTEPHSRQLIFVPVNRGVQQNSEGLFKKAIEDSRANFSANGLTTGLAQPEHAVSQHDLRRGAEEFLTPDDCDQNISQPERQAEEYLTPDDCEQDASNHNRQAEEYLTPDDCGQGVSQHDRQAEEYLTPDDCEQSVSQHDQQKEEYLTPDDCEQNVTEPDQRGEEYLTPDDCEQNVSKSDQQKEEYLTPDDCEQNVSQLQVRGEEDNLLPQESTHKEFEIPQVCSQLQITVSGSQYHPVQESVSSISESVSNQKDQNSASEGLVPGFDIHVSSQFQNTGKGPKSNPPLTPIKLRSLGDISPSRSDTRSSRDAIPAQCSHTTGSVDYMRGKSSPFVSVSHCPPSAKNSSNSWLVGEKFGEKDPLSNDDTYALRSNQEVCSNQTLLSTNEIDFVEKSIDLAFTNEQSSFDNASQNHGGVRVIVSHSEETSSRGIGFQEDAGTIRPGTPPYDSGPPSPYQRSLDSPSTPLNIQTDETMPPKGELSEQESIGGNSSSMWSVPAYNTTRKWTSSVVSYDLNARESWPDSDTSDSEVNASLSNSNPSQRFSTSPSFTNSLQPFIEKPVVHNFAGESPFSAHIMSQGIRSGLNAIGAPSGSSKNLNRITSADLAPANGIKKSPVKPRVYRCKECSIAFTSIKLRRMHPCEQAKSTDNLAAVTLCNMEPFSEENVSIAGSSSQNDKVALHPKPKKKYVRKPKATIKREMVLEEQLSGHSNFDDQYQINKTEPEDVSKSRLASHPLPDVSTESFESSTLQPVPSEVLFSETPIVRCQNCNECFISAKALARHMSIKHKTQKHQCATCGENFEEERCYFDHLMIHPLECQLCGKMFTRKKYLTLHMKWHMEVKPHKCDSCGKTFVTKQKLEEHMNTHTGNAPIKCTDCEKTFKRYSNLIQHRNRYHLNVKPKKKDYVCHCGEVLPSKKKLEWHKEIHNDKPKSCLYCCEKFVHTVSLTRHVRRVHDRSFVPKKGREGENIECPVCHLVFLKSSIPAHIKIHSGERPYPCHICGRDFNTKWNLQLHRWTHASRSARPYKCMLCKAAFVRKETYQSHMHSHRNERPYTCNICGCQFIRKYNCLRHMKEHEEGNKTYACTICNKTFYRNYYLKDHMRVHSGTRPFTCHICGKASTNKSNHNKHVKIHHAREPQNTEI